LREACADATVARGQKFFRGTTTVHQGQTPLRAQKPASAQLVVIRDSDPLQRDRSAQVIMFRLAHSGSIAWSRGCKLAASFLQ